MQFSALKPFRLEGVTIRILASSPAVQPLKQSVPGLSQPGSCSLSSTQMNGRNAAAATSAFSTSHSLEGYMDGQPQPPLGLGSSDLQSKSPQVRSSFLSLCPFLFVSVPHCYPLHRWHACAYRPHRCALLVLCRFAGSVGCLVTCDASEHRYRYRLSVIVTQVVVMLASFRNYM